MGNSKSQQQVSNNVDTTRFANNTNNTIHFNNIYNLHDQHQQAIKELNTKVECAVGILILIVILVVAIFAYKFLRKRQNELVERRAHELVLTMLEKGEIVKHEGASGSRK